VVIVDEAYIDFAPAGSSVIPLIKKYDNLLVIRTLSKSAALAGLRVGFAIGDANLITALRAVRDSFNSYTVDALAQIGARAAVLDRAYYAKTARKVVEVREKVSAALRGMGATVLPSAANFIFVRLPGIGGK
jgi:histidinol-phosphate aminotransferase